MHKRLFLSSCLVLILFGVVQAQLSPQQVLMVSQNFLALQQPDRSHQPVSSTAWQCITAPADRTLLAYVVPLQPQGFIVVSAMRCLYPVIAYSLHAGCSSVNRAHNPLWRMLQYDLQKRRQLANGHSSKACQQCWRTLLGAKLKTTAGCARLVYGPLLHSQWGGYGFEDEHGQPIYVGDLLTPYHYKAGCVAVSMSQILHYFQWPPVGCGRREYTDASSGAHLAADFGHTFYDWPHMRNIYHRVPSATIERHAMAELVLHCGIAHGMYYGAHGSSANIKNTPDRLHRYFRYAGHYKLKNSSWGQQHFWSRLRANIMDGYPVQMAVYATKDGAGHAIVCDGFDSGLDRPYYHLNMGWLGEWDAWYALEYEFHAAKYDIVKAAVFDIRPNPIIEQASWGAGNSVTLSWRVAAKLDWRSFELQQSRDGGRTWTTLSKDIHQLHYTLQGLAPGIYLYRVRACSSKGIYYLDSYSENFQLTVN